MNKQEVFDTVVNHLRQQKSCSTTKFSDVPGFAVSVTLTEGETICAYRGENNTKCAAGCLIPDEVYGKWMEGMNISAIVNAKHPRMFITPAQEVLVNKTAESLNHLKPHLILIADLQRTHDDIPVEDWENEFQELASNHGVVYTAIE